MNTYEGMTIVKDPKHIDTKEHGIFELCDICEYYSPETDMNDIHGSRRACLECYQQ